MFHLLLIFMFLFPLFAFNSIEVLNQDIQIKKAGYFVSDTNISSQDAKKLFDEGSFKQFSKRIYAHSFDGREYWYAFEIVVKNSEKIYFLDNIEPSVVSCDLFVYKDGVLQKEVKNGYLMPPSLKATASKSTRFALEGNSEPMVYLIRSKSHYPRYSGFIFGTYQEIENFYFPDYIFFIILSASLFTLLIYNLFIYFSTKDRSYLYYISYLFGYWAVGSMAKGYDFIFVKYINDYPTYQPFVFMAMLQLNIFGITLFTEKFLLLKEKHIKIQKVVRYLYYLNALCALPVVFNYHMSTVVSSYITLLANGSLLAAGLVAYKNGYKPAPYYLGATGIMLILMYIYAFTYKGLLEYNLYSSNLFLFSVWWDAIIMSFALAYRIRTLQEENISKERLLLLNSRKNSIGQMTGNIVHQWRTPLAELGASIIKLEAKAKYAQLPKKELLETIHQQNTVVQHLSRTIDTFQEFFKLNKGDLYFSLAEYINKSVLLVQNVLKDNFIKIECKVECDCKIKGDGNEFAQVLLNIIANAKDAILLNGRRDGVILVKATCYNKSAVIKISDNGGGIKADMLKKLFEPYTTDKKEGTGIGLYISKNIIVEQMRGQIHARNIEGGACFEIVLPTSPF